MDVSTLPTAPPFTAHVGNLKFDISEEQIAAFFAGNNARVTQVRFPKSTDGRSPGFAYVDFNSALDLKTALELSGTVCPAYLGMLMTDSTRKTENARPRGKHIAGQT